MLHFALTFSVFFISQDAVSMLRLWKIRQLFI